MMRRRTPNQSHASSPAKRLMAGTAVIMLAAGCSKPAPDTAPSPSASPTESSAAARVIVYEDPGFTRPLGRIGSFDVICADYKDPAKQTLQPEYVTRYKVEEAEPALHNPPLAGYVDPRQTRLLVGGSAPACSAITPSS